jgi:predicted acylesterase/phospholipase RssA
MVTRGEAASGVTGPAFDTLVMQGGGIRCLWQAGFLTAVVARWERPPARIVAVSAGAAIACAFAAGRLEAGVEAFRTAVSGNPKNFYPSRLLSRKRAFPHDAMYRTVLGEVLNDAGMAALQRGPDVDVLLCRPPRHLSSAAVTALLLGLGLGRQLASKRLCAAVVRAGRFAPEFVSLRSCRDARDATDLVLASSSTPPFTPLSSYRGGHVLDGGVLESVPISALAEPGTRALVLLTNQNGLPASASPLSEQVSVTCAAPSRHIAGAPWDYANSRLVDEFFALGREDGARFAESGADAIDSTRSTGMLSAARPRH